MEKKTINFINKLIEKSTEAFIMGLEIYNKPTIKYRVEGFSFFICNAWELMLKAKLLKEGKSIYFSNQPNRTISLTRAIELIFTNNKNPLRINLETINELRNTSTYFITEDYEKIYAPLFQACVKNYCDKLLEFHNIDITNQIAQDFLTLRTVFSDFDETELLAKYPPELAEKLIFNNNNIQVLEKQNNNNFAFTINHHLYITKNPKNADFKISVDRNSNSKGTIIREIRNPNNTHIFSHGKLTKYIKEELEKRNILFEYSLSNGEIKKSFTTNTLNLFIQFYDMKNNEKFSFKHIIGESCQYTYSINAAEFIINEIKKDPKSIYENLKKGIEIKK